MQPIAVNSPVPHVLDIQNLSVVRSGKVIISDINLGIKKGEFVGLVGPNGSGKTTLLLAALGILKAQSGSVSIYGQRPMSRGLNGKIGWVSQAAANLPKEIRIGAIVRGKEIIIPKSDFKFEKKDLVVFLTKREHLEKVESLFRISSLV